ncbi:uncharacterized protein LOC136062816 [Quercus suber]|uniref:uncharacterized protein LOC136062816 n=1 Tax=Quercus suber TaxID=58331 RepID=UPI0032DF719C
MYNGRTDHVEHVSHFNQIMVVHSKNEALMCKVFPSSLRLVAMRWFDGFREGKVRTLQLHDNALVVTLRIEGYDVKRVLVDQGSSTEIMYPDLFKRLRLKPKELACYNSPLIGFDGKIVFSKGQIRLLVQARSEVVEVNFIVVDAYSPNTTIVARPWFHAMGVVSSTLHLKVKYPSGD